MPGALWKVFGDPANQWMLGVMIVGLIGMVTGPWAIVRFVCLSLIHISEPTRPY